jgi:hypothetical protein
MLVTLVADILNPYETRGVCFGINRNPISRQTKIKPVSMMGGKKVKAAMIAKQIPNTNP